jgi:hypothetical protein
MQNANLRNEAMERCLILFINMYIIKKCQHYLEMFIVRTTITLYIYYKHNNGCFHNCNTDKFLQRRSTNFYL